MLFLGTSSGTPTRQRNVTGLALVPESGRGWHLVDCGEGTQHRLLHLPLSLAALEAVCITHVHGDHCYGLPGLLASAGLQGRNKPLRVVAPAAIEDWIWSTLRLTQVFLPFELRFEAVESAGSRTIGDWAIDAVPLSHRVPSYAYCFSEARIASRLDTGRLAADGVPRGPAWGLLKKGIDVTHEGRLLRSSDYLLPGHAARRIVVGGDNDRPELLADACRQAQVLVHEATYTEAVAARVGDGPGHSTAARVASFAQHAGVPNLVLTHFSPRYQSAPESSPSIDDIRDEAQRHYRGKLFLAEDYARFRLDRVGQFCRIG